MTGPLAQLLTTVGLLAALGALGYAIARAVARNLEADEDRASMAQWQAMCDALDLYDWAGEDEEEEAP